MEKELQLISDTIWMQYSMLIPEMRNFNKPLIVFNNRLKTTAGRCFYELNKIDISTSLYKEFKQEFILDTIPHEIAHQIDYNLNGRSKQFHGPNWKRIMWLYGIEPNTYHNYIQMRADRKLIK